MAATAQDSTIPLRGGDGKVKDDDFEDGAIGLGDKQRCAHSCCISCNVVYHVRLLRVHAVEYSPFYGIEKGAVLQEARIFHQSNLDPRKCQQVWRSRLWVLLIASPWIGALPFKEPIANAGECTSVTLMQVITKLLYLQHQGDTFTKVRLDRRW